jgi:hypothetical protein
MKSAIDCRPSCHAADQAAVQQVVRYWGRATRGWWHGTEFASHHVP